MRGVDPATRIGTCSQCGPGTPAYHGGTRGTGRWRCRSRVRAQPSVQDRPRLAELAPDRRLVMQVRKMRGNGIDITLAEWIALKERASGRCELCGREAELHLDHDHVTRKPRGLLCVTHNTGLGKFGDDPALLRAAAEYLEQYSTVTHTG